MTYRPTTLRCALLVLVILTGCQSGRFWLRGRQGDLPPAAFSGQPALQDVIYAVNANTDRVTQLQSDSATLRVAGAPALRANLAFARPRNFRLRAELFQFTGRELDVGSNDDIFWFWVRRDERPAVYYARHDQFARSPARDLIPIEPERLVESLGLLHIDPAGRHEGPIVRAGNRLELRSLLPTARGNMTRVLILDAKYGWIVEQQLFDTQGQLIVWAKADQYRFYADSGVSLPHHIDVQVVPGQPAQMAFVLDVNSYLINRLYGESARLWEAPQIEGSPMVDIAAPDFHPVPATVTPPPPATPPSSVYGPPRSARMPMYRGYDLR